MCNFDINIAKKLELIGVKKYQKYIGQVEIELNQRHNWIQVLAIFVKYLCKVYNNKKMI